MYTSRASIDIIENGRQIDRNAMAGLLIAAVLIAAGIGISGRAGNFLDLAGFLVVLGGTIGTTLVQFSPADLSRAWRSLKGALLVRHYFPSERIEYMVNLAVKVRAHGILILEREAKHCDDPFLKRAFELTADGQQHEDIRRILETEMRTSHERSSRAVQVFQTMGNYAPAFGLIGTLIGLIQMLGTLSNPESVGPAMSLALVTTLYGAILANLVFLPFAGKLKNRDEEELLIKAITIEGVLSLGRQENPIVLEQRLQSFVPLRPLH